MIHKIRVILDVKDHVFRDIEIKGSQTLWNLHLGIKNSFNLPGEELSSFYYSDDEWLEKKAVPLEDMSDEQDGETMSDVYIKEAFSSKGTKMLFKYGFIDLWVFFCELLETYPEKSSVKYPFTVFRFGYLSLKSPVKSGKSEQKIQKDSIEKYSIDFEGDFFNEDHKDDFCEEQNDYPYDE